MSNGTEYSDYPPGTFPEAALVHKELLRENVRLKHQLREERKATDHWIELAHSRGRASLVPVLLFSSLGFLLGLAACTPLALWLVRVGWL